MLQGVTTDTETPGPPFCIAVHFAVCQSWCLSSNKISEHVGSKLSKSTFKIAQGDA